jgi:biofilm PGA synthesis N-glycosyltransferase PgaC
MIETEKDRHPIDGAGSTARGLVQPAMETLPRFVLITPARNEAQFIELTIKSVVAQTVRPLKWVIVSDGSTDGTNEIVNKYAVVNGWIELITLPERRERHFAGKVMAFNTGWERVKNLPYEVICSLDADISFDPDYFEFLLTKFAENPRLGVGGTPFTEGRGTYDFRFSSIEHVSGACQLFRRECFDDIGGYTPIKGGGIDLVAVVTSRMKGWQTRSFPDKVCFHHRRMGSGMNDGLKLPYKWGQSDYRLGGHPAWQFVRCLYQMSNRPYIIGGLVTLAGYYVALAAGRPRAVSAEFAAFRGKEQMQRLKSFLHGNILRRSVTPRSRSPRSDTSASFREIR